MKRIVTAILVILMFLFSVCLLYRLGYNDGWNDRQAGVKYGRLDVSNTAGCGLNGAGHSVDSGVNQ